MKAAGDDEPRAPSGSGAEARRGRDARRRSASPAEPARITSGDAMAAAASASRSASVSASAAMMPPAARPSAAEGRASAAHALERQVAHPSAPRRGAGCPPRPTSPRDTRGRARSPRCGRGARPRQAPPATVRPWRGKLGAHQRRRPPRHLEEGLDLRGDGAAEGGVDLLEDEPPRTGAEVAGRARGRAPRLRRRERPALRVDDGDRAGGVDARRVHEHPDPAASREMRAGIATPVRSSAMSVIVMRP